MTFREECLFFVPARAVGGTTTPHSLTPTTRCGRRGRRGLLLVVVVSSYPLRVPPNRQQGSSQKEGRHTQKHHDSSRGRRRVGSTLTPVSRSGHPRCGKQPSCHPPPPKEPEPSTTHSSTWPLPSPCFSSRLPHAYVHVRARPSPGAVPQSLSVLKRDDRDGRAEIGPTHYTPPQLGCVCQTWERQKTMTGRHRLNEGVLGAGPRGGIAPSQDGIAGLLHRAVEPSRPDGCWCCCCSAREY